MNKKNLIPAISLFLIYAIFPSCKNQTDFDKVSNRLISQMTLEEKIGMIHGSGTFMSGGDARLGVPELQMSDGPCGVRMEINREDWNWANWKNDDMTYFPAQTALAATWDTALARQFGKALGQESKIRGKHVQLAPGINIIRTPLGGRNWEYMSEDPYLISKLVVPVIEGMQSEGVAACVKHYALNNQEQDRGTIDVFADERPLREIYLPGFEAAVKEAKVLTVMGAYNKFRGQHATYNEYLIEDILRGEWGFKGAVISDWGACHSVLEAALGGLDIEMGKGWRPFGAYFMDSALLVAINKGKVNTRFIDDKIRRILNVEQKLNILNSPAFDTSGMYSRIAAPERIAIAKKIAEESIVLLKNKNSFLPLDDSKIKSIAVIGDNATRKHSLGGGSTTLKARYEITPLEAIKTRYKDKIKINYARGYYAPEKTRRIDSCLNITDEKLIREAVKAASQSDIVLFFGGLNHNPGNDCEGVDKPGMNLPYGQEKLIQEIVKANPKTVVVLICGSPVAVDTWLDKVPSLLQCSYPGMESGTALTEVIFGDINPSGKLAMTFPKKLDESPAHKLGAYPGFRGREFYKEGLLVGYRYFDTKNVEPMFAFGFGLSYTTFEYSGLEMSKTINKNEEFAVSLEVTNSGKRSGKEIVQVYVRDDSSTVEHPFKELKGFGKVNLKPGEKQKLVIKLNNRAFEYYDPGKKKWVAEPGIFEILVGGSSRDIRLKGETELKETMED
jgi:beta-glucosidase